MNLKKLLLIFYCTICTISLFAAVSDFSDVVIDNEFLPFFAAKNPLMVSTGVKEFSIPGQQQRIIVSVVAFAAEGYSATAIANMTDAYRIAAQAELITAKVCEVFAFAEVGNNLVSIDDGRQKRVDSISSYLNMSEEKVRSFVKTWPVIGTWFSRDKSRFYLAVGTIMEKVNVPVTVSGFGDTREFALKDALKEAVRQGIGTAVESATAIENDKILSEKQFEFSYGYVEKYNIIKEYENNHITISATVSRPKILIQRHRLELSNLNATDRASLNIEVNDAINTLRNNVLQQARKEELIKKSLEACRDIFDEYRAALKLTYHFVPGEKYYIDNISGIRSETQGRHETVNITVRGTIKCNEKLYDLLLDSMVYKFETMFLQKMSIVESWISSTPPHTVFAASLDGNAVEKLENNGRVKMYSIDNVPFGQQVAPLLNQEVEIQIYLVDQNGDMLYPVTRRKLFPMRYKNSNLSKIISPYFDAELEMRDQWLVPYLALKIEKTLSIPLDVARRIGGIKGILTNNNKNGEELFNRLLRW